MESDYQMVRLGGLVYVDDATPALAAPLEAAFGHRRSARIRGVPVVVPDLDVLIAIKAATGRTKDREWLTQLRFIRDRGA